MKLTKEFIYALVVSVSSLFTISNKAFSSIDPQKNWGYQYAGIEKAQNLVSSHITHSKIKVAVIDTGIDLSNPALAKQTQLTDSMINLQDSHGHGTHIAHIVATSNPYSEIVPLRYYSKNNSGEENLKKTIQAIYQAINSKVKIINYSGGGPEFSIAEYEALKKAEEAHILVIAAAGNEHQNMDQIEHFFYPAAYSIAQKNRKALSNILSVTAIDLGLKVLPSSNWGKNTIHVAAPGNHIYSAIPGGRYGYMTGTSQATAFVSGLASLILSQNPSLSPQEVKERIMLSVTKTPELMEKTISGGYINGEKALQWNPSYQKA